MGRKVAFVAGTLLALVVVWGLGLESAIRLFDIGPEINPVWKGNYQLSRNPKLRYELAPGSTDGSSKVNRQGMRDRDYDVAKPPGTFRIAVLGDSIAYGLSVEENWTFSTQLEGLFAKYFHEPGEPVVEILNFGVTGYSFFQVMEALRTRALEFDPDLVVYAYSLNDPQEYSLEMGNLMAQLTEAEERYLVLDGAEGFLQRSRLVRLVRYLLSQQRSVPRDAPVWDHDDPQFLALREGRVSEYFAQLNTSLDSWRPIESGLVELAALSRVRGVPVHVMIFPLLTDLDRYPLSEVHTHLRDAIAAHGFPVLDLLDVYACFAATQNQEIAADALHPNKLGHALAAVALLQHLTSTQALPGIPAGAFARLANAASDTVRYAETANEVDRMRSGLPSRCAAPSAAISK